MFNGASNLKLLVRAFRYRNYRLFFSGQAISLIGTWTQQVALSWLVYRLTGSTLLLGAVAFSGQIPTFFLAPIAGVIADRFDRKRLLLGTQALSMIQALILAALVLTGTIATWQILALSLFIGIVNAFDIPIRQSFVVAMVEKKEDLGNAIALNSAMFNSARFIGPSVAGVLVAAFGEGICFLLNGISYVAVLAALIAIKAATEKKVVGRPPIFKEMHEGFSYARDSKPILAILALLAAFSLAAAPYVVLMPVFARDVLHGGANTYGFLMSSAGIGAVTGTIYLASRKDARGLIKTIPIAGCLCGVSIIAFALSRDVRFSACFLYLAGFAMMLLIASSNTIIQTIVDEDKRGRMMSLFAMSLMGTMPFGSLLAGVVARHIGVQNTLLAGASVCVAGAAVFAGRLPRLGCMLQPIFSRIESEAGNK